MFYVVAQKFVSKENQAKYLELAREMVDKTREEDGCYEFSLVASTVPGREEEFLYFERWESRAHLDAHLKSEHFVALDPEMGKISKGGEVWLMGDAFELAQG